MSNITNDKVVEYVCKYYSPMNEELGELRKIAEENRVPIILRETEIFLKSFLGVTKPKRILEIGTAVGYSSLFFASVCPDAQIVTIEKSDEIAGVAVKNIEQIGLSDRIKVLNGDGEDMIDKLVTDKCEKFDFVFIDAAKSHYKRFLDSALKLCKKDAIIVSDNALFKARVVSDEYDSTGKYKTNTRRMREYIDYIHNHELLDTSLISCGDGIAISRVK